MTSALCIKLELVTAKSILFAASLAFEPTVASYLWMDTEFIGAGVGVY